MSCLPSLRRVSCSIARLSVLGPTVVTLAVGGLAVLPTSAGATQINQIGGSIDGEANGDSAGAAVAMSGDARRIAVGAPGNDGANGQDSGQVRVYTWDTATSAWKQLGADIDGEAAGDGFGSSVAMSDDGTRIAVGAPFNDGANGQDSGHVRVYALSGTNWVQVGADIDGEAAYDESGNAVAMSGDGNRIVVGAHYNSNYSGHVRVYALSGASWTQLGVDLDSEAAYDELGYSVAMSDAGNRIVAGARYNSGGGEYRGHVRVYDWNGSAWVQLGADVDGESDGDQSGYSVAMSGDGTRIAIGGIWNDGVNGENSGHVRVYDWLNSAWTQVAGDIDGESGSDNSGWSVAMSDDGNRVAIGARWNSGDGEYDARFRSGHVRIYALAADADVSALAASWRQVGGDIDGAGQSNYAGASVAMSENGSRLAVGAPGYFGGSTGGSGHVRVFGPAFGGGQLPPTGTETGILILCGCLLVVSGIAVMFRGGTVLRRTERRTA